MQLLPHKVAEISDYERERGVWLAKQEKRMALLRVDPPLVSEQKYPFAQENEQH